MVATLDFDVIWVRRMTALRMLSMIVATVIGSLCISLIAPQVGALQGQGVEPTLLAQNGESREVRSARQDERLKAADSRIEKLEADLVSRQKSIEELNLKYNSILYFGAGFSTLLVVLQGLQVLGVRRKPPSQS